MRLRGRCRCGNPLPPLRRPGNARVWCSPACRARTGRAARRAAGLVNGWRCARCGGRVDLLRPPTPGELRLCSRCRGLSKRGASAVTT